MTGPAIQNSAWTRRFHSAEGARTKLVCFPHAGGAATFYFKFSQSLAPNVEVLAMQYPGRQDRRLEKPLTCIKQLADEAFEALRPELGTSPVFFGHSMGAIVAFEVARRMESETGTGPAALVASGRRAPSRRRMENVHRRDDAGIMAELKRLSGTDSALLSDNELIQMLLPAIRGDYQAIETYTCPPGVRLSCPVTVFTGDSDPQVTLAEAQAWRDHTTGAFDLLTFEGGHFYLTARPDQVLSRLTEVLAIQA